MLKYLLFSLIFLSFFYSQAQVEDSVEVNKDYLDSIYIEEVENVEGLPAKILHAEPLYIDLIRDLGARKGEKEWNVGMGIGNRRRFDEYIALVEYEWAPVHRLGLEVELPFSFFQRQLDSDSNQLEIPGNNLNSLKLAAQYSFWVSEKYKTSMALGYLHEFELVEFRDYRRERIYSGNLYNPFFIAAKRWGQNFHTLVYTGPEISQHFRTSTFHTSFQINTNFHYMIDGTRNFIGIEINKDVTRQDFAMTLRPQMRVGIADNLLIGIVAGIPVSSQNERLSTFVRLIYEPGHKH